MEARALFCSSLEGFFKTFFDLSSEPWLWLDRLPEALEAFFSAEGLLFPRAPSAALAHSGSIYVHPSVRLPLYGSLQGPIYIGPHVTLREGIALRGPLILASHCEVGHACEVKGSILLPHSRAPHFNYVGDSILGHNARLGAGAILANLRFDEKPVKARTPAGPVATQRRKCGAFIGDNARIGCNVVLQPGSVVLPQTQILQAP